MYLKGCFSTIALFGFAALSTTVCLAQQSYIASTIAGTYPSEDGGPATSALLDTAAGMAIDAAGDAHFQSPQTPSDGHSLGAVDDLAAVRRPGETVAPNPVGREASGAPAVR